MQEPCGRKGSDEACSAQGMNDGRVQGWCRYFICKWARNWGLEADGHGREGARWVSAKAACGKLFAQAARLGTRQRHVAMHIGDRHPSILLDTKLKVRTHVIACGEFRGAQRGHSEKYQIDYMDEPMTSSFSAAVILPRTNASFVRENTACKRVVEVGPHPHLVPSRNTLQPWSFCSLSSSTTWVVYPSMWFHLAVSVQGAQFEYHSTASSVVMARTHSRSARLEMAVPGHHKRDVWAGARSFPRQGLALPGPSHSARVGQ